MDRRHGWMIDELQHAGDEHLDPDFVAAYDRKSAIDPMEDLDILRSLDMNESSVVVDLGAGTGEFVVAAAPHCRRIVAVDVSATMLETLAVKARQLELDNVEIVHAGLLSYEHRGDQVDIVYSRNTLHHLPDFWKGLALQRIRDVLRSGGIFRMHDLVYSFDPSEAEERFESWLAGAADSPEKGYTRQELETHIREEHSTFSWLLEPTLKRVGFEIRDETHRPSGTYSAYTCVKK